MLFWRCLSIRPMRVDVWDVAILYEFLGTVKEAHLYSKVTVSLYHNTLVKTIFFKL